MDTRELERRLERLERVFDLGHLARRGLDEEEIARYYVQSALGYRFVHSGDGAMHMALNPDGEFDKDGYYGQARAVEARLDGEASVLELASGTGFNLRYLAERRSDISFTGIDIVPQQVEASRRRARGLANLGFEVASFQDLPFDSSSFDLAFVVESLCHATDMREALVEARRVLRPGSTFIVIDAWRTSDFERLPASVQHASALVEHAMSVGRASRLDDWLAAAGEVGFDIAEQEDLTDAILPNLRRFEGLADRFLTRPRLARLSRRLLPGPLLSNAVAAYLMPLTVGAHAHTYQLVALRARQ